MYYYDNKHKTNQSRLLQFESCSLLFRNIILKLKPLVIWIFRCREIFWMYVSLILSIMLIMRHVKGSWGRNLEENNREMKGVEMGGNRMEGILMWQNDALENCIAFFPLKLQKKSNISYFAKIQCPILARPTPSVSPFHKRQNIFSPPTCAPDPVPTMFFFF